MMAVIEIFFGDDVRTKGDILEKFEKSDINIENSRITNWDALEEILRDAVIHHSMNIILRGLEEANIEDSTRRTLMDIIRMDGACVAGSLTIENLNHRA